MNSITTTDLLQMETNSSSSSSTHLLSRSKKLPPPPLCLPATNTMTDEEKILNSNQQRERKKSTNNCCLSSSSNDCPHQSTIYTLPTSQRSQILQTLIASSSALLVPLPSETKPKKPYTAAYVNQMNLLKQRQSSSSKATATDGEWIDFMRLIVHKPLEDEIKSVLDKYKTTYFDRVNAPNAADDTIRSSLCSIASEAVATYSSTLVVPPATIDDLRTNISSPIPSLTTTNNGSSKRKRKNISSTLPVSVPVTINSQTKFVISHIIPGKYDNNNNNNGGSKTINQQKQFQKKYGHLFKFIPDKNEQAYLLREDHVKTISATSRSPTHTNNTICLMLYDEVVSYMDEDDLELSGISIDDSFLLPESFLTHIYSTIL